MLNNIRKLAKQRTSVQRQYHVQQLYLSTLHASPAVDMQKSAQGIISLVNAKPKYAEKL